MSLPASGGTMEGSGGNGGSEEKRGKETGAGAEGSGEYGSPGEKDNKGKGIMEEMDSGKISPTKGKPEPDSYEIKITRVYILMTLKEILDREIDLYNWQLMRDKIWAAHYAFELTCPGEDFSYDANPEDEVGMVIKETVDRFLPVATMQTKMMQKCVCQYLSVVTSMAIIKCQEKNRRKLTSEDLCYALRLLGFDDFNVRTYLENYEVSAEQREKDNKNKAESSNSSITSLIMPDAGWNKKKEEEDIAAAFGLMKLGDEYGDSDRDIRERDRLVLMVKNNFDLFGEDILEGLMDMGLLRREDFPNLGDGSDDYDDYYNAAEESGDDGK